MILIVFLYAFTWACWRLRKINSFWIYTKMADMVIGNLRCTSLTWSITRSHQTKASEAWIFTYIFEIWVLCETYTKLKHAVYAPVHMDHMRKRHCNHGMFLIQAFSLSFL